MILSALEMAMRGAKDIARQREVAPKCRFANARPEPDFRYFSNRTASRSLGTPSTQRSTTDDEIGCGRKDRGCAPPDETEHRS
jgi:hypothetical protein